MSEPIRAMVIDDSPLVCRLLSSYLHSATDIRVVGTALRGDQALKMIQELRPQAVTLDLEMPGMNGLITLENIMRVCPTPTVLVSGVSRHAATLAMKAIDLGAVDFVLKYTPGVDTDPDVLQNEIITKVRLASRMKVLRTIGNPANGEGPAPILPPRRSSGRMRRPPTFIRNLNGVGPAPVPALIVIGSSTGGPVALQELLSQLPSPFRAAIVVVQHLPSTFTGVLAHQFDRQFPLPVREAQHGDSLRSGEILIAPGDQHLRIRPDATIELSAMPEVNGHRPCVDVTMQSAAAVLGPKVRGVVLSGMGEDGAAGVRAIRSRGGRNFAQDGESCAVNGMPKRAIETGAVQIVGTPAEIGQMLKEEFG